MKYAHVRYVHKHSETIEYVKNQHTFSEIDKFHGPITQEFLGFKMRNVQGVVFM